MSEAEPLVAALRRIRRRLRFWAALEGAVAGGAAGLIALAVALAISRWRGVSPAGGARPLLLALAVVAAGALWRGLRRIPLERCARVADLALDRQDRVLSALALMPASTPMTAALLADAASRAAALAPGRAVPPRPTGLPRLALAGVAVVAAGLVPVRSRAARPPAPPIVAAAALTPIPDAVLAGERAQVRAAQEAARRLGDERIAELAADLDRTLRRLASGALDDGAALELLRALEAKAGDAARAADTERRAAEAAGKALAASEATRAAAEALTSTDEGAAERARAALAAAAAQHAGETASALAAAARGVEGAMAASEGTSNQPDNPQRRLNREQPAGAGQTPPAAGAAHANERHLEQLRRDLEETAAKCRAGDPSCAAQAERRANDLWRNQRRSHGAEPLRQLQRSVRQMRERVGRGEMRDGDEARAQRSFERGANGQGEGEPGQPGREPGQEGDGEGQGQGEGEGQASAGDGEGSGSEGAAEIETVAIERSEVASGGGEGAGSQPGSSSLGRDQSPTSGRSHDREARVANGAGPNRAEVIGVAAGRGFATRGYNKVFADYAAAVEDAMGATAVPDGKRYIVRRYFDLDPPPHRRSQVTAPEPSPHPTDAVAQVAAFRADFDRLLAEIARRMVGQSEIAAQVASALLAGGHVLLEGVPGLGKTLLVRTLAEALELSFSRIQFTPDLMPADIIGTNMIVEAGGQRRFEFQRGPIFAHVVLADEINRATPKTQSALLEAMQEQSVTVGKQSYPLPPPFFVLATQNPIEMEGTYPLPEAQLDRFFFKLRVDLPARDELHDILDRTTGADEPAVRQVLGRERLLEMRALVRQVPVARPVQDYAVRPGRGDAPGPLAGLGGEAVRPLRQLAARRAGGDAGGEDRGAAGRAVRAVVRRRPAGGAAGAAPPRAPELRRRGRGGVDRRRRRRRAGRPPRDGGLTAR